MHLVQSQVSPPEERFEKEQMGHIRAPSVLLPRSEMKTSAFSLHSPFWGCLTKI